MSFSPSMLCMLRMYNEGTIMTLLSLIFRGVHYSGSIIYVVVSDVGNFVIRP